MSVLVKFNGIKRVYNVWDILRMRKVRNEVASFMTHNTEKKSRWQQVLWYYRVYKRSKQPMHGYLLIENGKTIGYGLITQRQGGYWLSAGLLPEARGKGHGEHLFSILSHITLNALGASKVWLDVWAHNTPAINLYHKLGFEDVSENGGVIVMRKLGGAA